MQSDDSRPTLLRSTQTRIVGVMRSRAAVAAVVLAMCVPSDCVKGARAAMRHDANYDEAALVRALLGSHAPYSQPNIMGTPNPETQVSLLGVVLLAQQGSSNPNSLNAASQLILALNNTREHQSLRRQDVPLCNCDHE